jgi:hypothetical protein
MNKSILRYLVIVLIAVAVGTVVYHLNQPTGTTALGSGITSVGHFSESIGSDHDVREGGSSLIGGLSGVTKNLLLVAIVTAIVVLMRKLFAWRARPFRAR